MASPTPVVKTEGFSPKMIAATAVTTLVGVVVALLNALQENPDLLGTLDPVWQFIIITAIPPILAGFAAYQANPGTVTVESRS